MNTAQMDRATSQDEPDAHHTTKSALREVTKVIDTPPDSLEVAAKTIHAVNDRRFINTLKFLTIMQRVIVGQKLDLNDQDKNQLYLEHLHLLYLAPRKDRRRQDNCRGPTLEEWKEVERKIIALQKYLTPNLLTYVEINHLSGKILEKLALCLLGVSMGTLIAALLLEHSQNSLFLACFTVWSASTDALGSTAFLYVNALSIQVDPKVDLTSRNLVTMRLILGALFAVILTLPFGYESFNKFGHILMASQSNQTVAVKDSVLLLLPFTLGFSTPLALSILGRLIQSVRTFLGMGEQPDGRQTLESTGKPVRTQAQPLHDRPLAGE